LRLGLAYAISSFNFPVISEAVDEKYQGGSTRNSGTVTVASGMPAVKIDSPAIPGVFGHPEVDDKTIVNCGSKRSRTGRKASAVWEYLNNDVKPTK
jgi:hypothetical protein